MRDSKIIKHSPANKILSKTGKDTTFLVKGSTPFISAVKRIDKMLEKFDTTGLHANKFQRGEYKKVRFITVKGTGYAMDKVISIGLHFQTKKAYRIDVKTGTVEVLDEKKVPLEVSVKDDSTDDEGETELLRRKTSSVEVKIWLKRET